MNLSITPVNFKATQSCKNNNSQQNFEGIKARLLRHPSETLRSISNSGTIRKRDISIDQFLDEFEIVAKKIGLNTDTLDKKGVSIDFIPEESYSTRMIAVVKDKNGNVVQHQGDYPIFARVRLGNERDQGENLAYDLKGLNLDTDA